MKIYRYWAVCLLILAFACLGFSTGAMADSTTGSVGITFDESSRKPEPPPTGGGDGDKDKDGGGGTVTVVRPDKHYRQPLPVTGRDVYSERSTKGEEKLSTPCRSPSFFADSIQVRSLYVDILSLFGVLGGGGLLASAYIRGQGDSPAAQVEGKRTRNKGALPIEN